MQPKVSFLTMSHNYGHYLRECLDSIFRQTCHDFEVLVINAGSTDNTSCVAKGFPVQLLEIDDLGLSSSRNYGLERARGEYIVNLDADDTIHPSFLELVLKKAGPQKLICPGLQEFGDGYNSGYPNEAWGSFWGLTYQHFQEANRIFCCSMYPREEALAVGGYDPALDRLGCEDWCLWTDLVQRGCTVEIVSEILFYHRKHASSNSQRWKDERTPQAKLYIRKKHGLQEILSA